MRRGTLLAWLIVLTGSALTAAVVFVYYRVNVGEWIPTILPQVEEDSLYYLTQIREVLDGHPFLGNPFIREYADTTFPGLVLPVWIAAIPGLFGASVNVIFTINAFLYSILMGALFYLLCLHASRGNRTIAVLTAIVGVASLHNLLIRPVVMQVIYPAEALFLLAFFGVLVQPRNKWLYAALGATAVLAFYLYPFLWMFAFTAIGLLTSMKVWQRDGHAIRSLAAMIAGIGLLCIPQIITLFSLFHNELAAALNERVGLVHTHLVLPLTILNNKYVILLVLVLLLLRLRRSLRPVEALLLLSGGALLIGSVSNVVTGQLMDFHSHFWRLSLPLNIVAIATFIPAVLKKTDRWERLLTGFCLILLVFTTLNRTFIRANAYSYLVPERFSVTAHRAVQDYERIFRFFNEKGIRNQVILADGTLGQYIPLYTDNYLFYIRRGGLHTIPGPELLTRFLTYYVDQVDANFLRNEVDGYAGAGPIQTAMYRTAYGDPVQPIDLAGGNVFIRKALREHEAIRKEYDSTLRKFHVTYVVIDNRSAENPRPPQKKQEVYHDDRFTIYRLE